MKKSDREQNTANPGELAISRALRQTDKQLRQLVVLEGPAERLILLTRWLAAIGNQVMILVHCDKTQRRVNQEQLQYCLANLAAVSLLWFTPKEKTFARGYGVILDERRKQKLFLAEGLIPFDCASPVVDPRRKFRRLIEEVGAVANAIDLVENHGLAVGNIHKELIHVAAEAVAWLESFAAEPEAEVETQKLRKVARP